MSWKWVAIGGAGLVAGLVVAFLFVVWISPILLLTSAVPTSTPLAGSPSPIAPALSTASKDSGPPNQVAQAQMSSTPTTSTEVESDKKQLVQLLDAVRAEFANSGGAADTARTAGRADAALFVQQFEAQINAAMEAIDAKPTQTDQEARAVALEKPDGRPRHRRGAAQGVLAHRRRR